MDKAGTCILIPNHNHGKGFAGLIERLLPYDLPVLVVNDGSNAETTETLQHIAKQHESVSVLHLPENLGKGGAVMAGLHQAWEQGFSYALQIDADGQHNPDDVPVFLAKSKEHPQAMINGTPVYDESVPGHRRYARYLTHFWVWVETLSFTIRDSMCGFRVYPLKSVIQVLDSTKLGHRMDFDTEILVRLYWQGVEILEQPTRVIYPADGTSNFRLWQDNWLITCMHARLFFGMLRRLPLLLSRRRKKTPHQHWANIGERGSIMGMRILLWIYRHLGRFPFYCVLHPVMLYFSLFAGSARRASQQYLRQMARFQGRQDKLGWRDSYRHFYAFGISALDKIASWNGDIQRKDVIVHQPQNFEAILASGKGAVFLGSHLGNLEVCRALGEKGGRFRLNALVFHKHARKFQRVLSDVNAAVEVNLIYVESIGVDTAINLKQKVDAGEIVIIVGDRTPVDNAGRVENVDFLGKPAPFSIGPFVLASLLECPIYLLFCIKQEGRYNIYLEHFVENLKYPRIERDAMLKSKVQDYADRLAYYCSKAPEQWFNFYDFWRSGEKTGETGNKSNINIERQARNEESDQS